MVREIKIKKGQILQREGEYNTKGYMVKSGLLRSYSIDAKGKEHIFMFAPKNWIIADAVTPDLPSELFIDALEDTVALVFIKGEEDNSDTEKLFSRMKVLQKRIIMLMSASALKRYDHFIETYPNITQRVPQRMIASYLGITPEALSKAKGERKKKGI